MNRGALPIRKKRNSRKSSCRWLAAAVLLTVTSKNILQVSQCILDYFDGLIGYAIEFPDCCIQLSLKLCFFFGIFCLVSRFTDGCYFLVKNVVRIILGNIEFIKDMSRNAGGIHVALNTFAPRESENHHPHQSIRVPLLRKRSLFVLSACGDICFQTLAQADRNCKWQPEFSKPLH